jgi:hypothetical protein
MARADYLATHLAVGLAVLGMRLQVRTLAVFVLPGFLLALVGAFGGGFWAGPWVLVLTAWAFVSSSLSETVPLRLKLRKVLWLLVGVAVGGLFIGLAVYIPNPLAYVLAMIPGVLLLLDRYSHRPWRAALDCSAGLILLALLITLPESWLSLEASCAGLSGLLGFGLTWLTRIPTPLPCRPVEDGLAAVAEARR